ncbi:MAG: sulfurtransferase TusA family protein [Pseudomonadaceae bacterium]|nr:sulfurtransferase TusA family protein [Pseudomonadaceae bacterium]
MNSENNPTLPNNNSSLSYDQHLDARGLSCPLPLLKAKQCLNKLNAGQVLFIQATDPGAWNDFASYAKLSKHLLVSREKQGNHFHFLLRKGE